MNHAIKAIKKAGLQDHAKTTILTGPPEPAIEFEEAADPEALAAMNLEDTIHHINKYMRNSLYILGK